MNIAVDVLVTNQVDTGDNCQYERDVRNMTKVKNNAIFSERYISFSPCTYHNVYTVSKLNSKNTVLEKNDIPLHREALHKRRVKYRMSVNMYDEMFSHLVGEAKTPFSVSPDGEYFLLQTLFACRMSVSTIFESDSR